MIDRAKKFWRDHIFVRRHDLELLLDLSKAPFRQPAAEHGLQFICIDRPDHPYLADLKRDFPKQSRSFVRDIEAGCLMLVLGDNAQALGYFFVATRDFYDRAQYRRTFQAGEGRLYAFNFYVDPVHRSKPVARVLLSEGFRHLFDLGHGELVATCRSADRALLRLYRNFALYPTGRAIDHYRLLHIPFSVWTDARV